MSIKTNPYDINWDKLITPTIDQQNEMLRQKQEIELAKQYIDTTTGIKEYYRGSFHEQQKPAPKNAKKILNRVIQEAQHGQRGRRDKLMQVDPWEMIAIYEYITMIENLLDRENTQRCIDSPDLEF